MKSRARIFLARTTAARMATLAAIACAAIALPLIPASAGRATGQGAQATTKIIAIHVTGNKRFAEAQVVAASGLRIGDPAAEASLNDAASRLAQSGAFSDVGYQYRSNAGGWEAEFQVVEAAYFLPCTFDNFIWFSDADLIAATRSEVPLFDGSLPAGEGGLKNAVVAALNHYLLAHQVAGSTAVTAASDNLGGKLSTFLVRVSNVQMPVLRFEIAGGPLDSTKVVAAAQGALGSAYSRRASQLIARSGFTEAYQEEAYLQPKFSEPQPVMVDPAGKDLSQGLIVRFTVAAGPKYSWNGVSWHGNQALSAADLAKAVSFSAGEPARRSKLLAGWDAANAEFQNRGYLSVKVEPTPNYNDATATVSYDVQVTEGAQFAMGDLTVDDPSEKVAQDVAAAWPLKKGEVYDMSREREFQRTGLSRVLAHDGAPRRSISLSHDLHPDTRVANVLIRTAK